MIGLPLRRARADLSRQLASFVGGQPPFLSVYLDLSPGEARQTAADRLRTALAGNRVVEAFGAHTMGVQAALADHLRAAADDSGADDAALFVALMRADGELITMAYPEPPRHDCIEVTDVPRLGPLLTAEQRLTHHVVALVRGPELVIMTVPRHGEPSHATYSGSDPLTVAPVVQHACRTSGTRLLVLCAPSAELAGLEAQTAAGLDIDTEVATVPLDGLDDDALAAEIVVRAATHAAAKTVDLLRLWRFHHSHDEAVDGLHPTSAAIAEGRAALVLVREGTADEPMAWFGPDLHSISPAIGPVDPDAAPGRRLGRLDDVLIQGALASGCSVHIVPNVEHTLTDGVGAVVNDRVDPSTLAELLER